MPAKQNKKTVFIIMQDKFLLELYRTIFTIRGFEPVDFAEEDELVEKINSISPCLIVLEKPLTKQSCDNLAQIIVQKNIPILILTKKEETCNIEKDLDKGIYDYGDIMNDNIGDIVRRGEKLVEKWSKPQGL